MNLLGVQKMSADQKMNVIWQNGARIARESVFLMKLGKRVANRSPFFGGKPVNGEGQRRPGLFVELAKGYYGWWSGFGPCME